MRGARQLGRATPIAGGALLLLIGAYVAYYGWWEIRVLSGAPTGDPTIEERPLPSGGLQPASAVGPAGFALVFATALVAVAAPGLRRRMLTARRGRTGRAPAAPQRGTVDVHGGQP